MPLYIMRPDKGIEIPLNVVTSAACGGAQQVIIYESPGSNGGYLVNTGRRNQKITLTGKLFVPSATIQIMMSVMQKAASNEEDVPAKYARQILSSMIFDIERMKNNGSPFELIAPISNKIVTKWIITSFTWDIPVGSSSYINFTLICEEYRQVDSRHVITNAIGADTVNQLSFKELQSL